MNNTGTRPKDRYVQQQLAEGIQLARHVLGILCTAGGRLTLDQLSIEVARYGALIQALQRHGGLVPLMEKHPNIFRIEQFDRSKTVITVYTRLEICEDHCTEEGCSINPCRSLHICKFFLLSECTFKAKGCDFGHNFDDDHNAYLLVEHGLNNLSGEQLNIVFKLNRSRATVPMVCSFYNTKLGCRHQKSGQDTKCHALHLCRYYLKGECTFGRRCKRSHDIYQEQAKKILVRYGINISRSPKETLADIQRMMLDDSDGCAGDQSPSQSTQPVPRQRRQRSRSRSKSGSNQSGQAVLPDADLARQARIRRTSSTSSTSSGIREEPDICMFHLRGQCHYGDSCFNLHAEKQYHWQYMDEGADDWISFPVDFIEDLELNYSDPDKNRCFLGNPAKPDTVKQVWFKEMRLVQSGTKVADVRRLGTVSSVKVPDGYKYTTSWIWYWQDENGQWQEYVTTNKMHCDVCSDDIEEKFQQQPIGRMTFSTSYNKYEIDFQKMCQTNLSTRYIRPIKRLPEFPPGQGNQARKPLAGDSKLGKSVAVDVPKHWNMDHASTSPYFQVVPISGSGSHKEEYDHIRKMFSATMPSKTVKAIKRIQNIELWDRYERKKHWMEKKLSAEASKRVREKQLFHGTSGSYLDAICQQGFDWRLSGSSVGTRYGKGSYFHKEAKYSSCYTDNNTLFVVRVLVGDYTKGASNMVRPPPKDTRDPYGDLYDSCVDNSDAPKIFVIFTQEQCYPEYLVEY